MKTAKSMTSLVVSAGIVLAGCSTTTASTRVAQPTVRAPVESRVATQDVSPCPLGVSGAVATSTDVPGGIALDFTTSIGDVAELRARAQRMADDQERHVGADGEQMMTVWAFATVENINGGARVVLRPREDQQLDALREQTRYRVALMEHDACPFPATAIATGAQTEAPDHDAEQTEHEPSISGTGR